MFKKLRNSLTINYLLAEIRMQIKMDDGLQQDLQADDLKKEIEKLRETVGSSAVDDSDATSDDEGALHLDTGGFGGNLQERDDEDSNRGMNGFEVFSRV